MPLHRFVPLDDRQLRFTDGELGTPVLARLAEAISWHAFYGPESTAVIARSTLAQLDRDRHTRTIRLLIDGCPNRNAP